MFVPEKKNVVIKENVKRSGDAQFNFFANIHTMTAKREREAVINLNSLIYSTNDLLR